MATKEGDSAGSRQNPGMPGFPALGLACPACGGRRLRVLYNRGKAQKLVRRRKCVGCGERITTWERVPGYV